MAQSKGDLKIKYYCTNWGMTDSWDTFCFRVKEAGYDGVETWLPGGEAREEMLAALKKYNLALGLLSGGGGQDFGSYFNSFSNNLDEAIKVKPDYINCHTGKEYYSFDQNKKLILIASEKSKSSGIPIYHETHRGRFSFAAHITKDFLEKIPELSLALDISHWCAVHESLLADQKESVNLALSRTGHIHTRVGQPQAPQVNDPSAPEWKSTLDQHLAWWDQVVENHKKQGKTQLTMCMEFGPSGYLPTLPFTQQPVADQWTINKYMLDLLKNRYKSL
ncbi:sugar phosphate isomerase/epimerase family protein [Sphingobacterium endophyticum]|uniref:sugar phosphate isomerase/epimerase family protein n=1 Tax=Sphingobacterium endophyticum TaxID=2546448 RepID=UPI001E5D9375|nr:TIM barrel protein [Sphingobacterium endophyticum]